MHDDVAHERLLQILRVRYATAWVTTACCSMSNRMLLLLATYSPRYQLTMATLSNHQWPIRHQFVNSSQQWSKARKTPLAKHALQDLHHVDHPGSDFGSSRSEIVPVILRRS